MKVYKCDSCDVMIDNPHKVRMKEFCFEVSNCDTNQIFMPVKRKKKIHLCANCYRGLYTFAEREELSKYEKSTKCNQVCEYNSSDGCVVRKRNGVCPLLNVSTAETNDAERRRIMLQLDDFKAGDKAYILYKHTGYNRAAEIFETTVKKVGRKYVTVSTLDKQFKRFGNTEGLLEHTDYGEVGYLYNTREAAENEAKKTT